MTKTTSAATARQTAKNNHFHFSGEGKAMAGRGNSNSGGSNGDKSIRGAGRGKAIKTTKPAGERLQQLNTMSTDRFHRLLVEEVRAAKGKVTRGDRPMVWEATGWHEACFILGAEVEVAHAVGDPARALGMQNVLAAVSERRASCLKELGLQPAGKDCG